MASNIFSNITGGNWSLATNWSAGLPNSTTSVTFASGTYTSFVDSTGAPWTIQSLDVNVATVTLEVDANLTAGALTGNLGTINVDSGAILTIQSLNSGSGTISVSNGSELIVGKLNNSNGNITAGPNGLVDLGGNGNGDFALTGGTLEIDRNYLGSGVITMDAGTLWLGGNLGNSSYVLNGNDNLFFDSPKSTISNSFTGVAPGDRLAILGVTITSATYSGTTLTLNTSGGTDTLTNITLASGEVPTATFGTTTFEGNSYGYIQMACYCRGTLILTPAGEVPVESLAIGDKVMTVSGEAKPVKWIGRRSYTGWLAAGNPKAMPVHLKPGSLADGVPRRDLWVSPEHAIYIDGSLVPAALLANGVSIVETNGLDEIHYFHIELDAHDVIVAEGALAETFIDDDSRGMFHNAPEFHRLYPDAPTHLPARYCAPRLEEGFALEALRRKLAWRARRLRPDGTMVPVALRGHLDGVERRRITGWAFDPETPGTPVVLVVLLNGAEIARLVADRYRLDLEKAGIGDGRHAFELELSAGLAADLRHEIEVRRLDDGASLKGSPAVLEPTLRQEGREDASSTRDVPLGALHGYLACVQSMRISGWAQDSEAPARPVGLVIRVNDEIVARVLANRYRRHLEAKGLGGAHHGFELVLPRPLSPLIDQEIHVTREADGAELPASPRILPAATSFAAVKSAVAQVLDRVTLDDEVEALALLAREADQILTRRAEREAGRAEREAQQMFRRRWGRDPVGPDEIRRAGLRALVVDLKIPDPGRDAGSVAILSHIRALQALGYAVSLVAADEMRNADALARLAKEASIDAYGAPFYASVEDVLSRQVGTFDLVYLHRAEVADRYLALVRRWCRKARILYSVADLHYLRIARQARVERRPELAAVSQNMAALELWAARRADIVVTHSLAEAESLRRTLGEKGQGSKVQVVPFAVAPRRPRKPFRGRRGLAFIGSFGHAPNGDAVHHLTRDIMPLVWQADPTITCRIVGHGWQASHVSNHDERIEVTGAVADLDEVFAGVRLTVAPLRFGAGIKGKVLDSFAAGLPCVMTPIAAEGLPLAELRGELVAEDSTSLAGLIVQLHADAEANARIGDQAARLAATEFSQEQVTAALRLILTHGSGANAAAATELPDRQSPEPARQSPRAR
jgi:glycosyltransferase involved in cell wall biosynthesis